MAASVLLLCFSFVFFVSVSVSVSVSSPVVELSTPQNGMNFLSGEWSSFRYNSSESFSTLASMKQQTNTNFVALTFTWYQWSINTTAIYPKPDTPTDIELEAIVKQSHSEGIKVMMRPLVDPDWSNPSSTGTWRGQIGTFFNASNWSTWFSSYRDFIVKYARLASDLGVDQFCVGGELVEASHQTEWWRQIVAAVRATYGGPITYSANWGNEHDVQWWDVVDAIGVDAYYPLANTEWSPSVADLVNAWQPIVEGLEQLSVQNANKPVLFTEIGYCSVTGANTDPAHCGLALNKKLNLTAQADLYLALFEAFTTQDWFGGVYWWAWTTDPNDGGSNSTGFSPNHKPAAVVLSQFYR